MAVQFNAPVPDPNEIRIALFSRAVSSEGWLFLYTKLRASTIERLLEFWSALSAHRNVIVTQQQESLIDKRNILVF
ncbi:hypothetical protein A6J80_16215 [Paracoccus yeei]|uniref:Uncharacterized protein n=1 Tax=Paracoccus yeei TaxID=147645 RepID=A0A1V0GV69_9RHOB|nr:hypothetical protein A6J80_16215 [Paracoccus yeei]